MQKTKEEPPTWVITACVLFALLCFAAVGAGLTSNKKTKQELEYAQEELEAIRTTRRLERMFSERVYVIPSEKAANIKRLQTATCEAKKEVKLPCHISV